MDIGSAIGGALAGGSIIALPLAFAGGVMAGLNPCCLALYPAAAANCCVGRECSPRRGAASAMAFVFGMAAAMAMLGIAVAMAGRVTGLGSVGRYLVAIVPLLMGLHLLEWIHLPLDWGSRLSRVPMRAGSAFGMGFLLSLVIGPCGTPLLASVLSYAARQGQILYGALLLFLYGLGVGIPMLVIGTTAGGLVQRLDKAGWKVWVDRTSGAMLLALGFYLVWTA